MYARDKEELVRPNNSSKIKYYSLKKDSKSTCINLNRA